MVRRHRARWVAGGVALLAVAGGTVAFLLTRPGPVLLDPDDFSGVLRSHQNSHDGPPGWTNCDLSVSAWVREGTPDTTLVFGTDQWAGAAIAVVQPSPVQPDAQAFLDSLEARAEICATSQMIEHGFSIEPLTGLEPGEVGWRTEQEGERWGEYVLIPLDELRLLAVGFQTTEDEPPVDLDRMVALAKQGAEQFPPPEG